MGDKVSTTIFTPWITEDFSIKLCKEKLQERCGANTDLNLSHEECRKLVANLSRTGELYTDRMPVTSMLHGQSVITKSLAVDCQKVIKTVEVPSNSKVHNLAHGTDLFWGGLFVGALLVYKALESTMITATGFILYVPVPSSSPDLNPYSSQSTLTN